MGKIGKTSALLLTLIVALSCLTVLTAEPINAQSTPMPSIPQFTLMFQDNSYIIQPTTVTTTNPYTGNQTVVGSTIGAYIHDASITVKVTNQPFTPYIDTNNNTVQLYYGIRWKGEYTVAWEGSAQGIKASNSDYTNISLGFTSNTYDYDDAGYGYAGQINWQALGNPVEIQVEAIVGYITQTQSSLLESPLQSFTAVASSDWSNTQTIIASNASALPNPTMPQSTATPSSMPSSTSTVPEFSWLVIVPLLLSVFCVAVIVRHRKNS